MIAFILKNNRLSLRDWNNMTPECKQSFVAAYLRQLGK